MNSLSINLRKVPFSRITFFLILGIVLGNTMQIDLGVMILLLCVFFGSVWSVFLLGKKNLRITRCFFGVSSLFVLSVGFVLTQIQNDMDHVEDINQEIINGETFFGKVIDKSIKGDKIKYIINIDSLETDSVRVSHCSFRIMLTRLPLTLNLGDNIQLVGKVNALRNPNHSLDFNYKKFLARKQIYYQMYKPNSVKITQASEPTILELWQAKYVLAIEESGLKDQTKDVLKAMLAGDKSTLGETTDIFRKTGTSHVLAISGLHVGIITMLIHFLCGFLKKKVDWIRPLVIIAGVWLFCLLSGAYPSTVRACTMVSLYCIGLMMKRKSFGLNLCCIAAFFMLLHNPNLIFDIGFQFSFLAVLGILLFYQPLYRVIVLRGISDKIWQMTVLSLSAQIFILPLSIYYFHSFPVYFIVASWIAVPMTFLIVITGLILVLCQLLGFEWNFLADLIDVMLTFLLKVLEFFARIPGATLDHLWPSIFELIMYFVFFGVVILFIQLRTRRYMALSTITFGLLLLSNYRNQDIKRSDKLVIYKCPKYKVMDYVSHGKVVRFFDNTIDPKKLNYVTKSSTSFYQVDLISMMPLNVQDNHFIQIQDRRILFKNKKIASDSLQSLDIVLTDNLGSSYTYTNTKVFSVDRSGLESSFPSFEQTIYLK